MFHSSELPLVVIFYQCSILVTIVVYCVVYLGWHRFDASHLDPEPWSVPAFAGYVYRSRAAGVSVVLTCAPRSNDNSRCHADQCSHILHRFSIFLLQCIHCSYSTYIIMALISFFYIYAFITCAGVSSEH